MEPIGKESLRIILPTTLYIGVAFLAGSEKFIQYFPDSSKSGLLFSSLLGSASLIISDRFSQERQILTIASLAALAFASPFLVKKLPDNLSLSPTASIRLAALQTAIFVGTEFVSKQLQENRKQPSPPPPTNPNPPPPPIGWWSDEQLIHDLKEQGFEAPIERGGGGDCLFYSIAFQVNKEDWETQEQKAQFQHALLSPNKVEKANFLRQIAMEQETQWINQIRLKTHTTLTPLEYSFIEELYKDMLEEIEHVRPQNVLQRIQSTHFETRYHFCISHFEAYKESTKRTHNWAGTPEAMAIAFVLNRSLMIYGKEERLSLTTLLDGNGHLLPFYSKDLDNGKPPITIFKRMVEATIVNSKKRRANLSMRLSH